MDSLDVQVDCAHWCCGGCCLDSHLSFSPAAVGLLETRVLHRMGISNGHYVHTQDLLDLDFHRQPLPFSWYTSGPSPLRLDCLQGFLCDFLDSQFVAYLAHGLLGGFRLGFSRTTHLQSVYCNHLSSTENPQTTTDHLSSEREAGRIVGPLPSPTWPHIHVSPMGLVPKNHSDRWRLIVDLSSPHGHSVNDGISSDLCSLRYVSLDNATEIVMGLG